MCENPVSLGTARWSLGAVMAGSGLSLENQVVDGRRCFRATLRPLRALCCPCALDTFTPNGPCSSLDRDLGLLESVWS